MALIPTGFPIPECTIQVFTGILFLQSASSSLHQHFMGIFAGCILLITLFLAGMNVVIEYTLDSSARNFISTGNFPLPFVRAFMEDLNLMSSSVSGMQNLLERCVKAFSWGGMYFRADMSHSIVNVRGKSMNTAPFYDTEP